MKNILRKISTLVLGRKIFQKLFELLYKISIKGMNFGLSEASNSGEKYVLRLVQKETSSPIIFDVGANKGQYANLVNEVFMGNVKIYSFEPGHTTYTELTKNTKNIKNIRTINFGLGSINANMELHYDIAGSGLASVHARKLEHMNIDFSKKEMVEIKTLDGFCNENNIEKIDLLKIDVEGHEMEVLKGAQDMLAGGKIKAIQFEFGGANIDSKTYFQDFYYLLGGQYTLYRELQNGLYEIKKYSELQEIFTTINYFAKLK